MDWKQIVIWFGQWILVEVGKKFPKVGEWIKANAPVVIPIMSAVVALLGRIFGVPMAGSAPAAPVPVPSGDPVAEAFLVNYVGTLAVDNVVRKFLWHWLLGKVVGLKAAKAT